MEQYKWIIIAYFILVLIMTFILIGMLEAHRKTWKAWLYVLIQPFGFLIFMYHVVFYLQDRRKYYSQFKVRKKYKAKWL